MLYRLSTFVIRFRVFKQINEFKISMYVLILFALINMPLYFIFQTLNEKEFDHYLNNDLVNLDVCYFTKFGQNMVGHIILVVILTIDNIFSLAIQFISQLVTTIYIRKFLKTNFALNNLVTAARALKGKLYPSNNNNEPNEITWNNNQIVNQHITKLNYWSILYFLILNLSHLIFSFIVLIQPDESSLLYVISLMIINIQILIKYGQYFWFFYFLDADFKQCFVNLSNKLKEKMSHIRTNH